MTPEEIVADNCEARSQKRGIGVRESLAWQHAATTIRNQQAEIDRLRAKVEEGEWQPIETAPKDGTRILLWLEPTQDAMPFAWKNGRWMGDDYPLNMAWPTHWMPLPEPPALTAYREAGQ